MGQAELWMFCCPKSGGYKPVVDNDLVCYVGRSGVCPGLKM